MKPNLTLPAVFDLSYYANSITSVFLLESVIGKTIVFFLNNYCELVYKYVHGESYSKLMNKKLMYQNILYNIFSRINHYNV